MRSATYVLTAVLLAAGAGSAAAQATPAPTPAPQLPPATPPLAGTDDAGPIRSHWTAAAFISANIDDVDSDANVEGGDRLAFGGQIAYLWRGIVGGEFLADSGRAFGVADAAFLEGPRLNTYMANIIVAVPLGADGQFQPFLSGGIGQIELVTDFTSDVTVTPFAQAADVSIRQRTPGANIGAGLLAFAGKVGFRGDVRYYRTDTIDELTGTPGEQLTQTLLSDLPFWRASVGVAFQW
jgi:hypothetical protein